jgi:hypothetical protein
MRSVNRGLKSGIATVPAPVGGWNVRDSLAAMDPEDAVTLDNWFPGFGSCISRAGSSVFASGISGIVNSNVKTLAEFNAGGLRKFIAGGNGAIWNITAGGVISAPLGSPFTNDVWDWAQFDDASGGARMGLVNGADAPQIYDGNALGAMTISGSGLTPANLNGIHIHKNRSYFWDDRTQDYWYSAVNALGGTLTKFPLGRVNGTGGNLTAIGTWSHDSGNGLQDLIVFVFSSGDVFVYQGSDPSNSADWGLVGRYTMAAPIGKRCIAKVGADLVIGTKGGYKSLAQIFAQGRDNEQSGVSSKIRGAVLDATRLYGSSFGWDMKHFPVGNYVLVNVPTGTSNVFEQHVMNTETKAWCRFKGMNALCWGLFNDELYFGTSDGRVLKANSGTSDAGEFIRTLAQQAWNYFGDHSKNKRVTALQPYFQHQSLPFTYTLGLGYDFGIPVSSITVTVTPPTSPTWADWEASTTWTLTWDSTGGSASPKSAASGMGRAVSLTLSMAAQTQRLTWLSTMLMMEAGGF